MLLNSSFNSEIKAEGRCKRSKSWALVGSVCVRRCFQSAAVTLASVKCNRMRQSSSVVASRLVAYSVHLKLLPLRIHCNHESVLSYCLSLQGGNACAACVMLISCYSVLDWRSGFQLQVNSHYSMHL